jgi:hypothetical protein
VAMAHGGTAGVAESPAGGADVWLSLPAPPAVGSERPGRRLRRPSLAGARIAGTTQAVARPDQPRGNGST